ncbi:hypothetical protein QYE76_036965 [Lolium multiflorum]|uniref:Uncharacterized protein n=1 Tax=Lolium multiflorum TaxID=4521 RepID=A0AAD8VMK2_LOLMU|nr:hypothetical protein QYE76_036965 [Lolium multiflorum]
MDGGKRVQPDLADFVPHAPARLHAYADLEESTEMMFGSFHFLVGKEGPHRLAAPIFLGPLVVEPDFSGSSTSSVESGDEEVSPPRFTKPADGGALADLFGDMTFEEVFTDLYDGVTCPEADENTTATDHQICVITGAGREEDEESEAFDDLGNPYVEPADLTRGTGNKYIGTESREKAIMVIKMSESVMMRYLKHAIIDMYEKNLTEGHLLTNGFMHGHTQWMSDDGAEVNGAQVVMAGKKEGIMILMTMKSLLHRTMHISRGFEESRLRVALDVLQMKAKHGWTDTSIDDILEYLKDLLSSGNTCPGSLAEAKRITCPLDLPHEKYHACINDCIMYRKEHVDKTKCPVCDAERYKKGKKKAPRKVVWYFPLAPRLQRFYADRKEAKLMRRHAERKEAVLNDVERIEHPVLTHPSDASLWKALDNEFGSFGVDPRNIRLGASTNGFNPFGNQSSTHSTWPVFVWIYNLPPWLCMKRKYIQMSMLIQGPTQPGNDINMYLELLKEELETLWAEEGVDTWDAVKEEYFPLRAALITTVQDYLGYSYISCQVCHGHKDPSSSKTVYMGHRRWLHKTDPWRKRGDMFDGTNEPRGPPRKKSSEEIDTLLKVWKECPTPGKIRQKPGEKKKKATTPLIGVWKRRSVFWDLPYWKILDTPHCLDVMHITKNVCESLLGTLLNMPDRTKDGPKARHDMKVLGIREDLQIRRPKRDSRRRRRMASGAKGFSSQTITAPSCFTFSPAEVDQFFNYLLGVRVPFGYSGLISRYMDPKKQNFSDMKSHDCHVMMTQILLVAIRGIMDDHVRATLTGL